MICTTCPRNTFSVGRGGIRIDGTMGAFANQGEDGNVMPLRMDLNCQVHGNMGPNDYKRNESCTPWQRTGTSLKAYSSTVSDVIVDFELSYPVFFDEEGSVSFKYRKDTIRTSKDYTNGVFQFLIDGNVHVHDSELAPLPVNGVEDWKSKNITRISKGYHTLLWRYTKLNTLPLTEFLEAEIEVSSFLYVF